MKSTAKKIGIAQGAAMSTYEKPRTNVPIKPSSSASFLGVRIAVKTFLSGVNRTTPRRDIARPKIWRRREPYWDRGANRSQKKEPYTIKEITIPKAQIEAAFTLDEASFSPLTIYARKVGKRGKKHGESTEAIP